MEWKVISEIPYKALNISLFISIFTISFYWLTTQTKKIKNMLRILSKQHSYQRIGMADMGAILIKKHTRVSQSKVHFVRLHK